MSTTTDVHSAAREGFAREAGTYSRGRPDYPPELQAWLEETLALGPGRRVADVGAGTGKFCKLLSATGAQVLAIEPVDEMRAEAAKLPGVVALAGTAQALPVADASLDAIVCAQAFHWFATTDVLDEFARALKPGGRLGLVWNVRDESVDWVRAITELITPYEGDAPRFYKGDWKKPFPHPRFGPLRETAFAYEHVGSAQQVVIDRFMSVSFLAALPPAGKAHVQAELEQLVATHPALQGRAELRFPYRTLAFAAVKN
ncbi:class I SAM-dependent methyltransferase [Caenimonas aquaedulcis]|uniref:Methyltransferase domain-containing protein n=1 Tax=Caenimonas aquaedulcis TaxID=2793270 RepID=A0A931H560_9BURK|nr:class I SAM-dependent methyltransferase [Caenimonas aquaedulcis]MBG9388620.1 methyltransferase domain-containing protein [Caenimonas aquaedulcis]